MGKIRAVDLEHEVNILFETYNEIAEMLGKEKLENPNHDASRIQSSKAKVSSFKSLTKQFIHTVFF